MEAIQNKEGLICLETETEKIITALSSGMLGIKEVIEGEIEAFEPKKIAKVQELGHLPFALSDYAISILALAEPESYVYGDCNGNKAVWDAKGQVFIILADNNGKKDSLKTLVEREFKPIPPEEPTELMIFPTKLSDYTGQITILKSSIGRSFLEIGRLLYEVREKKIYQEQYNTFQEYLALVFPQSRATAYALIQVYQSKLEPELCLEVGWAKARELASLDAIDLSTEDKKEVIEEISKPEVSTVETKAIVSKIKTKKKDKPVKETIKEAKKEVKEAKTTKKVKAEKIKGAAEEIYQETLTRIQTRTELEKTIHELKQDLISAITNANCYEHMSPIENMIAMLRAYFEDLERLIN